MEMINHDAYSSRICDKLCWTRPTNFSLNLRIWPWKLGQGQEFCSHTVALGKIFGYTKFCLATLKTLSLRSIRVWKKKIRKFLVFRKPLSISSEALKPTTLASGNKKICAWERRKATISRLVRIRDAGARNFQHFTVRLPYGDTILRCPNYWFLLARKGGGQCPSGPRCYAYGSG